MKEDCIFCRIANGQIPSATLYEDENFRVILDLGPASRGHALILPKEHYQNLLELDDTLAAGVIPLAKKMGAAMSKALGCAGFNLVQNNGEAAGQTVPHFHVHIIPRYGEEPRIVTWNPGKASQDEMDQIVEAVKAEL